MRVRKPNIEAMQKRVANTSIGASTLRSQGVSQRRTIGFLLNLNLAELRDITKEEFSEWLDEKTESLVEEFKITRADKDNWGAARKAINIFLENAFYNRFLTKEYGLQKLEEMLELPLDNRAIKEFYKDSNGNRIAKRQSIKHLDPGNSEKLQKRAKEVAKSKQTSRVYLDLELWRA